MLVLTETVLKQLPLSEPLHFPSFKEELLKIPRTKISTNEFRTCCGKSGRPANLYFHCGIFLSKGQGIHGYDILSWRAADRGLQ